MDSLSLWIEISAWTTGSHWCVQLKLGFTELVDLCVIKTASLRQKCRCEEQRNINNLELSINNGSRFLDVS